MRDGASVCGTGGRWFEPNQLYQQNQQLRLIFPDHNYPKKAQRVSSGVSNFGPTSQAGCPDPSLDRQTALEGQSLGDLGANLMRANRR
jgi:hypothetical protein